MKLSRKILITASVILLTALPAFAAPPNDWTPRLLQFAGRLHPLLLHFPIALILTVGLIELGGLLKKNLAHSNASIICLTLAAIFAAATVGSGLANAAYEMHSLSLARTLTWHRWLGIITASSSLLALILLITYRLTRRATFRKLYAGLLVTCIVGVCWAAHLGGTMVYGSGYLTEIWNTSTDTFETASAPNTLPSSKPATNFDDLNLSADPDIHNSTTTTPTLASDSTPINFAAEILPLFETRCFDCHGNGKKKGNLQLDQLALHWHRPEAEWIILPENAAESELIRRVRLPANEKGHMPPKGARLTKAEIARIARWIDEGATTIALQPVSITVQIAAQNRAPEIAPAAIGTSTNQQSSDIGPANPLRSRESLLALQSIVITDLSPVASALTALNARGAVAHPLAQNSNAIEVAFNLLGSTVTDADLHSLRGLEESLVWLDLSGTAITDEGIKLLSKFTQLRRLNLAKTSVGDSGLSALQELEHLEYLNLYATAVTDNGLKELTTLTKLRHLFLWQTPVTRAGAIRLSEQLPKLTIIGVVQTDANPPAESNTPESSKEEAKAKTANDG